MKTRRTAGRALGLALAGLALIGGLLLTAACPPPHGRIFVRVAPPVQIVEVEGNAPGPEYVWIRGYHRWDGQAYVWVSGRWERRPHARAVWVEGHWVKHRRGWYWEEGHWR